MNTPRSTGLWALAALIGATAAGCGSGSAGASAGAKGDSTAEAINDKSAHTGTQIKAIRHAWDAVAAGEMDKNTARESLKKAAWSRASWVEVRKAALEELLKDTENLEDTRRMMCYMLPTDTQWEVVALIGTTAVEHGWTDMTVPMVRSWSRPVVEPPDDSRPERKALQGLYRGTPVEDVVFQVFTGSAPASCQALRDRDRQDAWSLLRRIDKGGARTVGLLSGPSQPGEDEMIASLRAAARDLDSIPETGEQVAWVARLRRPEYSTFWSEAAVAIARLGAEQKQGFELRHAAAVLWASANHPEWLTASRAELRSQVQTALQGRSRHQRARGQGDLGGAGEALPTWESRMVWGDMLLVLIAAQAIADKELAAPLFSQADEDHEDRSTEYGGVLDGSSGAKFSIRTFPPRPAQRYGDRRFVASPEMIDAGVDALFHYHMHVNEYSNAEYAGPSKDDIDYARLQGRSCLVFTFISKDVLDADYYQPNGAVIDLGEVHRP